MSPLVPFSLLTFSPSLMSLLLRGMSHLVPLTHVESLSDVALAQLVPLAGVHELEEVDDPQVVHLHVLEQHHERVVAVQVGAVVFPSLVAGGQGDGFLVTDIQHA